jgi:hypothetical protein
MKTVRMLAAAAMSAAVTIVFLSFSRFLAVSRKDIAVSLAVA